MPTHRIRFWTPPTDLDQIFLEIRFLGYEKSHMDGIKELTSPYSRQFPLMLVSNPWCYPPCPTILVGLPSKRKNAPTWGVGARRARYLLLLEGPEKKLNFCCNPIVNHHRLGILWECSRCIAGILWECSRYITGNISPDKFHTMDRWGFWIGRVSMVQKKKWDFKCFKW